jgi:hypothetical protein
MHGLIFSELQKYVAAKHGDKTWSVLLEKAGLGKKMYLPVQEYPDSDGVRLVSTASSLTGRSVPQILEDFGEFIAPDLIAMYRHLLKPEWKTLDVIEYTEGTVHAVVRVQNPGAKPPELKTKRPGPDQVLLTYTSPRQMCALAIGIGKGLAKHFKETLTVTELQCMHKGATSCEISYRRIQ